jgi:kynurenine formamidase
MNVVTINIDGRVFEIDAGEPLSIAIPMDFAGAQPNAYGVEKASAKACEAGDLVGDTRRGGSCNFEQITFIPHCNGTHTESIGHITHERISIHDALKDTFIPATLVSIEPEKASETNETYAVKFNEDERLITKKSIENALLDLENPKSKIQNLKSEALIIRTLPNDESKKSRTYLENIPPFFSTEAMEFIVSKKIKHLLCDLPSIDRIFDEGQLANHRIFWNVEQGAFETSEKSLINNTITELIFAPDEIADGDYILNLQIAAFVADASPSRPILFSLI